MTNFLYQRAEERVINIFFKVALSLVTQHSQFSQTKICLIEVQTIHS